MAYYADHIRHNHVKNMVLGSLCLNNNNELM